MGSTETRSPTPRRKRRLPPGKREDPPLDELSRTELYERAKDLDIRGRSNMNKAQLARALRSKR